MASKTPLQRRQEMFAAWCENPAVDYVAKKCHVHLQTAKKYRKIDRWDVRLEEIQLKATKEQDYDIAEEYSKTLRLIRAAKAIYATALKRYQDGEDGKFRIGLTDIKELANTEMLMTGKPTERVEISLDTLQERYKDRGRKKGKVKNDNSKAPPKAKRGNAITGKNGRRRLKRPRRSPRVSR